MKTTDCRHERVILQSVRAAGAGYPEFSGRLLGQLRRPGGKAIPLQHIGRRVEVLLIGQSAGPPRGHIALHLVEQRADLRLAEILNETASHKRRAASARVGVRRIRRARAGGTSRRWPRTRSSALCLSLGVHRFARGLARNRLLRGRPRGYRHAKYQPRHHQGEITQGCPSPLLRRRPSSGSPGQRSDTSTVCDPCRADAAAWHAGREWIRDSPRP